MKEKLYQKFISMKGNYNLSTRTNPNGLITFRTADLSIFGQYFHNISFETGLKLSLFIII